MKLLSLIALTAAIAAAQRPAPAGGLIIGGNRPPCPLKHTAVQAEISGPLARVDVTQIFENPLNETIEAVYVFPLPHNSAVDRMDMKIGDRSIRGVVKRREEARKLYEQAMNRGQHAALLDQERTNIFTQSVANIPPRGRVEIHISYVETVPFDSGNYEFVFPMVVGPRYVKGSAAVPDKDRINPLTMPAGARAGHDISIEVKLDAGAPVNFLRSLTHDVDVRQTSKSQAAVTLRNKAEIPNKDFVLQYDVTGARISDTLLAHRGAKGGYFTFVLQPPDQPRAEHITPKEIVFVLDTSGSMSGFPIEKAKEAMRLALDGMHPRDTFNLITFAGDTHVLFDRPVPATAENLSAAKQFLASRSGRGGTEMMKAIRAALDPSGSQEHVRIVCFMTDGYVGNDLEIVDEVKRHANARVFSFGIGGSVNRFLLDKMAEAGRGEVEYVGLQDDGSAAAKRFHERVRTPLLTDVAIDWGGVVVSEVYPQRIPDLFSAKPMTVSGRYAAATRGTIKLRGKLGGRPYEREIAVTLPGEEPQHDVVATLWARRKIDHLMAQNWSGTRPGGAGNEEITKLGLDYSLMTPFTSFVAVEDKIVTEGGRPRRVEVPVEMPSGVTFEGDRVELLALSRGASAGFGTGMSAGVVGGVPSAPPAARQYQPPPQPVQSAKDLEVRPVPSRKIDASLLNRTGEVRVKVFAPAEARAKLEALSAKVESAAAGFFIVRVDASKLEAIALIDGVRYLTQP